MDWIRVLVSRCAAFIFAKKLDADLEDELRSHLELATAENVERGMSEEAARTKALRQFGKLTEVTETYRLQRGLPFMETLIQAAPISTTFPSLMALMSRMGGWPKKRLYSRLNWLTLSYPTSKATVEASTPSRSIRPRAACSRNCF
jgi:hypothetical protein